MSSIITYAVPMFMFGKYKRMKEYIKELEENIDELETSLQELRLHLNNRTRWSRQVERVGQVSRMARWRFITMVLFYVLALIATFAPAFPYSNYLYGPLGLAGIFYSYLTQRINEENEHLS